MAETETLTLSKFDGYTAGPWKAGRWPASDDWLVAEGVSGERIAIVEALALGTASPT